MEYGIWMEDETSWWGRAENMVDHIEKELELMDSDDPLRDDLIDCINELKEMDSNAMVNFDVNMMGGFSVYEYRAV